MDLFDIVGPIMVGPSSSHTAGAVRMGYVAGKLLGEPICKAEILLYGSFLATGEGHGTKKALVAGLLGMQPDDYQIADSFEIAAQRGITVAFGEAHLEEAHPNTAVIRLTGVGENIRKYRCLPSVVHGSVLIRSMASTLDFQGNVRH